MSSLKLSLGWVLFFSLLVSSTSFSQSNDDCFNRGMSIIKKNYPLGYKIFNELEELQQLESGKCIRCGKLTREVDGMETMIHESVHYLDAIKSKKAGHEVFVLADGSDLHLRLTDEARERMSKYHIGIIYSTLAQDELGDRATTYLLGDKEAKQDYITLLDELNAYTLEVDAACHLPRPKDGRTNIVAGPIEMLCFNLRYYELLEQKDPAYFKEVFLSKEMLDCLRRLIIQAQKSVAEGSKFYDLMLQADKRSKNLDLPEHQRMMNVIFER